MYFRFGDHSPGTGPIIHRHPEPARPTGGSIRNYLRSFTQIFVLTSPSSRIIFPSFTDTGFQTGSMPGTRSSSNS